MKPIEEKYYNTHERHKSSLEKNVKTVPILKLTQHYKDVVLSKFMNSCNLNKNTNRLFYESTKFNITFTWKNKHTRNARSILRKKNYKVRLAVNNH